MNKSILRLLALWACTLCSASTLFAQTSIGLWDFNSGDLTATAGSDLQYADGPGGQTETETTFGSTSTLGIPDIKGTNAYVMNFPAATNGMGYLMPTPTANGGSGTTVNQYTYIMDVFYPGPSGTLVRPLIRTYALGTTEEYIIINSAGAVGPVVVGNGGVDGPFVGSLQPNTWYRLGLSVTAGGSVMVYTNGVQMGSFPANTVDGYFSLDPNSTALILGTTSSNAAPGYVNSIQLRDVALNAGQMKALGGPSAAGILQTIPPVPSFVDTRIPDVNATGVSPEPGIHVVLNQGDTTVDPNSIKLYMDGSLLSAAITPSAPTFTIDYAETNILRPLSMHELDLVYSDSVAGLQTNSWTFSVCNYQDITLPAPIYLETFDEVAEGGIPAGWTATNWTDSIDPGLNLADVNSDSYLNWVTISVNDYTNYYPWTDDYISPGFPEVSGNRRTMIPPIVENGVLLNTLVSGNLLVAESDQRANNSSQVQVIFTKDYDLTGYTNVYVSFHMLNEQNQDNISSVEYSIDHGATWQPLLYMLDDGTTDSDGSDVVTNSSTGQIDVNATFNTARNDQAHDLAYGAFIGAAITTNLIPYIRPCRNDDPVQQKRIEVFRLPLADNQPAVRLRFGYAGTASWFFDIDDLGFYSINTPVITSQPQSQTVDANTPATFTVGVSASGTVSYQWEFNGRSIAGATNSTYTIASVAPSNGGLYDVIVSNGDGSTTSGSALLTVVTTPEVVTQPIPQVAYVDSSVTFGASARGGRPLNYQWYLDGTLVPGANTNTLTLTGLKTTDAGNYTLVLSNSFGTNVTVAAHLTVYSGAITNGLVAHLKFDNDYTDASGNGTAGATVGSPTFEPGILGEAVHVTSSGTPANSPATNNYVTLGMPSQLSFGTSDFSISFWTKMFSQNDDKPFISNKDWGSGSNPGWVLATEGGGMKWNFRDSLSGRRDSPTVSPQLEDGNWHNLVVTFIRSSIGSIYVDGQLVNTTSVAPDSGNSIGSADTTLPVNIGQDGTGQYTDGGSGAAVDMLVDDLGIWNRALAPTEAASIYVQGEQGKDLTTANGMPVVLPATVAADPASQVVSPGADVTFSVTPGGTPPFTFQWQKDGTAISGVTSSNLTMTAVTTTDAGDYSAIISNSGGSATSHVAQLTVFTGTISQDLVAHLKFDGDYTDSSGSGTTGTAVGTPAFEPGIIGQAVHVESSGSPANSPATNNYVTLGTPAQLNFGTNDFSISFWAKVLSQNDDKPFIANKDWNSGSNPGWALATEGDGTKWNLRDDQSSRRDSPHVTPQLEDGNWHNLLVTFLRGSAARIYVDGQLMNTTSLVPDPGKTVGSVDTSLPVNIGQDGTGTYTDGGSGAAVNMLVDDLGIWRRVVTPQEAQAIYVAGQAGLDLTQAGQAGSSKMLHITSSGGKLDLSWQGLTGVVLQRATSLDPPNWTTITGTDGASSYSPSGTNTVVFYRLFKP